MDIDISDILASVSAAPPPSPPAADLQLLTRHWVAERAAPELLPWPADLVARVTARLARQIASIEEETMAAAAGGEADKPGGGGGGSGGTFRLVVLQTDVERVRFLVRSLVRARVAKLDRFPLHYGAQPALLAPAEAQYLAAHTALLHRHYAAAFLAQFPAGLQRMDDSAGGISMVERPDADAAVFVRVLSDDVGVVAVDGTDVRCNMARGDVWCVRWSAVRELVAEGRCELV